MLIIKVFTDKVAVNGYVRLNDNKALIDAINTIPQMINNAQNTEIKQPTEYKPTSIQHGNDFISITTSGFLFQYEFDVKNTKWTLQNIGKMKNP